MSKKLVIIGASGHGKVVADIARLNDYEEILFLDDNTSINTCGQYEVLGTLESRKDYKENYDFFIAIGNSQIRERIFNLLDQEDYNLVTLIHPSAIVAQDVKINKGTVVMAGTVINSDTYIGKGVIVNTSSSIDHENYIDDFVHISVGSHLAGNVKVGKHSWIGIGSIVKNNINISSNVTTGAGAVVVKDITEKGVYVGVPSNKLKTQWGGGSPS